MGRAGIQTWGSWRRNANATSVKKLTCHFSQAQAVSHGGLIQCETGGFKARAQARSSSTAEFKEVIYREAISDCHLARLKNGETKKDGSGD